jgi:hypothetical protein
MNRLEKEGRTASSNCRIGVTMRVQQPAIAIHSKLETAEFLILAKYSGEVSYNLRQLNAGHYY